MIFADKPQNIRMVYRVCAAARVRAARVMAMRFTA
jgi:hypothetical protein